MIIKRGKTEGWLHLDHAAVVTWAESAGVTFSGASPALSSERGIVLRATHDITSHEPSQRSELLSVNEDLVLSQETVKHHAQFDQDFRQVLDSLDAFGRVDWSPVLTLASYVKTLPCELLPTFWSSDELRLLIGTTLAPAVSSKLNSLRREYDLLRSSAATTRWFQIVEPRLDFDDWLQVDAMFRSRALDFHGSCMIPGMDLASHAAGQRTNAIYDRLDHSYPLYLMDGRHMDAGEEVMITYGDEKGACEMLFSYGFIDEHMETAETLFLGLSIPSDDVYRDAKLVVAQCAPGFKIVDTAAATDDGINASMSGDSGKGNAMDWSGDFIWLLCVNQEDGFQAQIAVDTSGGEELQATFQSRELRGGAGELRRLLGQSDDWDVYRLRAIVILQQRIFDQLQTLYSSQEEVESRPHGDDTTVRDGPFGVAMTLRRLEFELLERAYEDFERQKLELAESSVVKAYLERGNGTRAEEEEGEEEEDFA